MNFALQPHTTAGAQFVALAEQHATDFATRADQHDRDGSFPFENITAMQRSGVMAACVPTEFGGLGVESLHDATIGVNRLGRGDGSTAIAATMHIYSSWSLTRSWRASTAAGKTSQAEQEASMLHQIGSGQFVRCSPNSESGTDMLHPFVEATKVNGGWHLNGRKIFGTLSPAASLLSFACRVKDPQGGFRRAYTGVLRDSVGMVIQNNWDALGMRASGSHDIVFHDCFVPQEALKDDGQWGEWTEESLSRQIVPNIGLVGAFLGVAEAARELILATVTRRMGPNERTLAERGSIQRLIAEIEIDLAATRAMLARTATMAEGFFSQHAVGKVPMGEMHVLMKDFQCTKWFVNRKSIEIVDRALTISGGAGYLSGNPLSRLYRDVRAGPFMQMFSPTEAFEYIGKVALGLDPHLNY